MIKDLQLRPLGSTSRTVVVFLFRRGFVCILDPFGEMIHSVLYGIDGSMEVDVVVVLIDGPYKSFTGFLARVSSSSN